MSFLLTIAAILVFSSQANAEACVSQEDQKRIEAAISKTHTDELLKQQSKFRSSFRLVGLDSINKEISAELISQWSDKMTAAGLKNEIKKEKTYRRQTLTKPAGESLVSYVHRISLGTQDLENLRQLSFFLDNNRHLVKKIVDLQKDLSEDAKELLTSVLQGQIYDDIQAKRYTTAGMIGLEALDSLEVRFDGHKGIYKYSLDVMTPKDIELKTHVIQNKGSTQVFEVHILSKNLYGLFEELKKTAHIMNDLTGVGHFYDTTSFYVQSTCR